MKYAWILAVLVTAPTTSFAMSPDSYRKLKAQTQDADATTRVVATSIIDGYFIGIADAYGVVQTGRREWRPSQSFSFAICIPESVELSHELIRVATDSELEHHENASDATLTAYTLSGLHRMFPCDS
jgi:hypothetical protein